MCVFDQSSLDLSEFAKVAKKKLQSVRVFLFLFFQAIIHQQMAYICLTYIEDILPTLFQLSNHQFEELAMDVYDEVDRRETDAGRIKKKKKTQPIELYKYIPGPCSVFLF